MGGGKSTERQRERQRERDKERETKREREREREREEPVIVVFSEDIERIKVNTVGQIDRKRRDINMGVSH